MRDGNRGDGERKRYRYPENLSLRPSAGFWRLRDIAVLGAIVPVGFLLAVHAGILFPLAGCAAFAVLSARPEGGVSVFDVLKRTVRYLAGPRVYVWRPAASAEQSAKTGIIRFRTSRKGKKTGRRGSVRIGPFGF